MAVRDLSPEPPHGQAQRAGRYRPLPAGPHGLDPQLVKRDQRERLQSALIELIDEKGYQGVRIVDLVRLDLHACDVKFRVPQQP